MIHRISADKASFRTINFTPGFNAILAERTEASGDKDSRNGLGKSTIVHIIHFCLGSDGAGLAAPELNDWAFTLDLDLLGKRVQVTRRVGAAARKVVVSGDTSGWPIAPKVEKLSGEQVLKIGEWNDVLGELMFGLDAKEERGHYSPTFRGLIPYFARNNAHAFGEPFEIFPKELEWQRQVANAYLLGLEWRHAQELQLLRDREKQMGELKRLVKTGVMAGFIGDDLGTLEAKRVQLEAQRNRHAAQLNSFRVVEQYREIERVANRLTQELHDAANLNLQDQRQLQRYQSALEEEKAPVEDEIEALYERAGVELSDVVTKRLEETRQFHEQVIANRRKFLADEIAAIGRRIEERRAKIEVMSNTRAVNLSVLKQGKALDEFTKLQALYAKTEADFNTVEQRIANWKQLDSGQSQLNIDKEQLALRARSDFDERNPIRSKALEAFNTFSEALYEAPGSLVLNMGPSGLKLDVEIERKDSEGFKQMKVFCYDVLLSHLWANRSRSPGFLIHDSPLFADVDERQVAHALSLANSESEKRGFQYICMFNSDKLPKAEEFPDGFDIQKKVRLRLTDDRPEGSLLGIRF